MDAKAKRNTKPEMPWLYQAQNPTAGERAREAVSATLAPDWYGAGIAAADAASDVWEPVLEELLDALDSGDPDTAAAAISAARDALGTPVN